MARMSRGELYAIAYNLDPKWRENFKKLGYDCEPTLRACECIHAHGGVDAESGTVDASTGFFYRIDRWMVVVDQQGFLHLLTYETEDECRRAFNALDDEYSDWDNEYVEM